MENENLISIESKTKQFYTEDDELLNQQQTKKKLLKFNKSIRSKINNSKSSINRKYFIYFRTFFIRK